MKAYQSGIKLSLQEMIAGTNAIKEDYDINIDHNNYIVIKERETFINEDDSGNEYEDERWNNIIIVSLNKDTSKFEIAKIWSRPEFDYGGENTWEIRLVFNLNHYLKSVTQYF